MSNREIKPIIAGNWKMNLTNSEGVKRITELNKYDFLPDREVVICTPFVMINEVKNASPKIEIGAQNVSHQSDGAYTGEVSNTMLQDLGLKYTIVGHSERRGMYFETDEIVCGKVKKLHEVNITPILCIGETLEENEKGETFTVLERQLKGSLNGVDANMPIVIAYEPIWAIGTGKTATSEVASTTIGFIKEVLNKLYPNKKIPVLYGGSVNPSNIKSLMEKENIDGVLVGGASLKPEQFIQIINF